MINRTVSGAVRNTLAELVTFHRIQGIAHYAESQVTALPPPTAPAALARDKSDTTKDLSNPRSPKGPLPNRKQSTGHQTQNEQTSPKSGKEYIIKEILQENTTSITKWVSTILALTLPPEALKKAQSAINTATEELLIARINVLKSVDGHIFVGYEPFSRNQKENFDKR